MTPTTFPEQNVTFAKDQSQYQPLPAYRADEPEGRVISRWQFTWKERLAVLLGRPLWLS